MNRGDFNELYVNLRSQLLRFQFDFATEFISLNFFIFTLFFLIDCTNKPGIVDDLLIESHFTFGSWQCFLIINWFIWLAA